MKTCPNCGAIHADNEPYCENCGFDPGLIWEPGIGPSNNPKKSY